MFQTQIETVETAYSNIISKNRLSALSMIMHRCCHCGRVLESYAETIEHSEATGHKIVEALIITIKP
jgi:hypothetical protein